MRPPGRRTGTAVTTSGRDTLWPVLATRRCVSRAALAEGGVERFDPGAIVAGDKQVGEGQLAVLIPERPQTPGRVVQVEALATEADHQHGNIRLAGQLADQDHLQRLLRMRIDHARSYSFRSRRWMASIRAAGAMWRR